jgi:sugar lactone lactonase YvrE
MIFIRTEKARRKRRGPAWGASLAGLICLAFAWSATAQVTVQTIGGGVRQKCGPAAGFVAGGTYEVAQYNGPYATALDSQGNLWLADRTNSDIEEISQAGGTTTSITTHITPTAPANYHAFTDVNGVALDAAGSLYVLLPHFGVVKYQIASPHLNELSEAVFPSGGALATAMLVDFNSNVFVSFDNGNISRFAMPDFTTNNGPFSNVVTAFNWQPAGMALCANGLLAVSDTFSNAIYLVNTNSGAVALLAGGNGAGYQDGESAFAQFQRPHGLAASADGQIVVCDTGNNRVRVIDASSNTTTLYGTGSNVWTATCCECDPTLYAGWVDGPAGTTTTSASGRAPVSVTIAPSGTLFVTELTDDLIRSVTGSGLAPVNLAATSVTAVTLAATDVTATNATLNGTIYPGGDTTAYYFEWGQSTNYTNYSPTNYLTTNLAQSYMVAFATLTNNITLSPGITYHFQLVATNAFGADFGGDLTFTTTALGPVATTLFAANVTATTAILNGLINPEGDTNVVYFQWGVTTNNGNRTPSTNLTTNLNSTIPVSATLSNLQPNTTYFYQVVTASPAGSASGNELSFTTGNLQPPTITFSPNTGYFPECVTISVTSSVPILYYTTDGNAPTTNSTELTLVTNDAGAFTNDLQWCNSQHDLSYLQFLAIETNTQASTVVLGGAPTNNRIGFAETVYSGSGATAYIPIVVNLQSGAALKSLQFLVEINRNSVSVPPITNVTLQALTPEDLALFPGPAPGNTPVAFESNNYAVSSNGVQVLLSAEGLGSGLNMQGSGVAALLAVHIPTNATAGQSYTLNVLYPTGTSDGAQNAVTLAGMAPQSLVISDPAFLVGDSAPANGYNAGEFGNGILDNTDVNNALYASVGIRVPYVDSDIYSAMDAYPPAGDDQITYLDWVTILYRSVGVDTNNYIRYHTTNGFVTVPTNWIPGAQPLVRSATQRQIPGASKSSLENNPPGLVWLRQALVGADTVTHIAAGSVCSIPIYVNAGAGYSLSGLQFRAVLSAEGGASLPGAITFVPASGVPAPAFQLPGLSSNDIICAWGPGAFSPSLQDSNYLGAVTFQVSPAAQTGDSYALHFLGVDGAPDSQTIYQLESLPGAVWVNSAAPQPPQISSDEWRVFFFGSLTNSMAGDNVDADGDGMPNWQEYLAGTNPLDASSKLQFEPLALNTNGLPGLALTWLTAPGKTYILESISSLAGRNGTAINTNFGDGNYYQFIQTNYSGPARFYQLRLQP